MERVIAYVDGYNLYHGLREKGWKRFYWLNVQAMVQHLLKPNQVLVQTKYFTTIVERPTDKHRRQAVFLEALQTLPDFHIHYGYFLSDTVTCYNCGHTYQTHHEKMSDVNLAVEMLMDAFQDQCDMALLVSGDSDSVGVIQAVRQLPDPIRVVAAFPPRRVSKALQKVTDGHIHVTRRVLSKSVFPDQVIRPDGYILHRPTQWC